MAGQLLQRSLNDPSHSSCGDGRKKDKANLVPGKPRPWRASIDQEGAGTNKREGVATCAYPMVRRHGAASGTLCADVGLFSACYVAR